MIIDFNQTKALPKKNYEYCICGAGAAGIALALELASHGKQVALFEGGDTEYTQESQSIYNGYVIGENQYWLDILRLRFLGGTTNHWAGRCRPYTKFDFSLKEINGLPGWPINYNDMAQYLPKAIDILDLPKVNTFKNHETPEIQSDRFEPDIYAMSKVRFKDKFSSELKKNDKVDLFINANLIDIQLYENFTAVKSIKIANYNDSSENVQANNYILAMGAIENARLLLNANSQLPAGIGNQSDMVGKCFMEHFNVRMGDFVANSEKWQSTNSMGFFTTQDFARKNQTGMNNITFGMIGNLKAYGRTAELKKLFNRLSCSLGITDHVQFLYSHDCVGDGIVTSLCEQFPNKSSYVALTNESDRLGLKRIKLNWQLSEADMYSIRTSAVSMAEEFAQNNLGRVKLSSFITNESEKIPVTHHAHQMGTTRMSSSEKDGVVDENCKVHGIKNLYIAGSSVFPTGGGGNPTMPLLQLTFRLAEHLINNA